MKKKEKFTVLTIIVLAVMIIVVSAAVLTSGFRSVKQEEAAEKARLEKSVRDTKEKEKRAEMSGHITAGLKGSKDTLVKEGDKYVESGAFAVDDRSGAIDECSIKGDVDTDSPGTYKVSYTFSSGGGERSVTRNVHVVPEDEFAAEEGGVPVMMYHYVYTDEDAPSNPNANHISAADLEEQIRYLKERDYYYPSFAELRAYIDGEISLPARSVILTFDNGSIGFMKHGIPLFEKYEIPAVSFITGVDDGNGKIREYASPWITFESHSYDMHKAGGNMGHRGVISAMSQEEILADLEKCRDIVVNNDAFTYPYGDVTEDGKAAVERAGISCAFTTVNSQVRQGDDFRALPRVRVSGLGKMSDFIAGLM